MKRINFILPIAAFMLSGLTSSGQTAWKQASVFKTNTTDICADNCAKQFTTREPEGAVLWNYWKDRIETEVVGVGEIKRGVLDGPVWGDCVKCFRAGITFQNCSRTDTYQDNHVCLYVPVLLGAVGLATQTHPHGAQYTKTFNWNEEVDVMYDWCCFFTQLPEVNDAVATVSPGKEISVNYTGEKGTMVVGFRLGITEIQNLPPQFASIKYNIDGLDITTGQKILMNTVGEHKIIATIKTKSGGVVNYNVPFSVIKPITVEEITQQATNYGETEFKVRITNNKMDRSGVAWVSATKLNMEGYVVNIEGPGYYDLPKGSSATINVTLRPSKIRHIDPAKPEIPVSFDFIVSSPTGEGLIIDRKTITVQTVPTTTSGGITGSNGPQQIRALSIKTISGEVVDVKIPNIIRSGDHVSGSVATQVSSSTLQGAVIEIDGKQTSVKNEIFKLLVPAGVASMPFIIKDSKGMELARTEIPVNVPNIPTPGNNVTVPVNQIPIPPQHSPGSFAPINYCQPGQPLTINGFFDGNASNTNVSINNIPCEIIAESDRVCFASIPSNLYAGETYLSIQEGAAAETLPIQVITTNLSANKTIVRKGANAKITATVSGLGNLDLNKNNFKIELINGSPGIIQFREANATTITKDINSSNTKNGFFTFTTDIVGTTTGSYTISSNVSSTTCTDCWKQYEACIAKVEADEKQCYKDCDKSNGGTSCYLACSAGARLQEAECFAQYLGCIRKKMGY